MEEPPYSTFGIRFSIPISQKGSLVLGITGAILNFKGISWNSDETLIAYVAEEPSPPSPHLQARATRKVAPQKRTLVTGKVKGIGRRNEGKPMLEKRQPALFVINI
ncbi:hypothetical protein GBA52_005379 [Prunus armeniaca]|nr:hypothetical protein GBA52_005379 [Prunus armeniaca]